MASDEKNKQTVGAQIPDRLFQVINLFKLVKNQSKSQIIRDALLLWVDSNNVDINDLINDLRQQYKAKWLRTKSNTEVKKYAFVQRGYEELEELGVSEKIIDKIFQDFEV